MATYYPDEVTFGESHVNDYNFTPTRFIKREMPLKSLVSIASASELPNVGIPNVSFSKPLPSKLFVNVQL